MQAILVMNLFLLNKNGPRQYLSYCSIFYTIDGQWKNLLGLCSTPVAANQKIMLSKQKLFDWLKLAA